MAVLNVLVFFAVSCLAVQLLVGMPTEDEIFMDCMAEHNISSAETEALMRMNDSMESSEDFEADDNYKCYTHCTAKSIGILKTDGTLNITSLQYVDYFDELDRKYVEGCAESQQAADNECEYAFNMLMCVSDAVHKDLNEAKN
ncbi:Obp57c [Drosophila busckii]|uniref:Obp57c n=1 Tax=Drosophila busckii TaxID=30019 RepID=A0A0M3QVE8_DROBS|nr:general odorant-binding protein 57c [Drosophila busckii]ALC42253.1 Obp57c [Drosophila busckii]